MHILSRMKYGIILWLTDSYSTKDFGLQRKVICLIFMIKGSASCRNSFKAYKILTIASIYILEVLSFIKKFCINIKHNYHVQK